MGFLGGGIYTFFKEEKKVKALYKLCQKNEKIIKSYCFWVRERKSYDKYLRSLGFENIVVYGAGYLGKSLISELKDSCVEVLYAVDEHPNGNISGVNVIEPDQMDGEADVVIVTAVNDFREIKDKLSKKICKPIISIEDLIYQQLLIY